MKQEDDIAWPFMVALFGIVVTTFIGSMMTLNVWTQLLIAYGAIVFFACVALFLCLAFTPSLKVIPIWKKLIFAFCPILNFSCRARYWFLKHISPEVTYEQYVKVVKK